MAAEENNNFKEEVKTYFKGVKTEWSKVSWPTRQQTIFETGVVLIVVIFFTVVVFLIDIIFDFILKLF